MPDKSPRQTASKKSDKSIKEKRAIKKSQKGLFALNLGRGQGADTPGLAR